MKKSIKKSSRRKWIVGGVAFFGSIALLTTGFATWVVGVNESSDDGEVTIGVDTVDNKSVIFLTVMDLFYTPGQWFHPAVHIRRDCRKIAIGEKKYRLFYY